MSKDAAKAAIDELITSFNDLNASVVEQLDSEPSPLEFMRFVARNSPFIVRGGASTWQATKRWNSHYLKNVLGGQTVNVAVTPSGNADAPTFSPSHGGTVISKPHEEDQLFEDFLDYVMQQEIDPEFPKDSEVRYAQTQNDNLRHEYMSLFQDAQKDIPFARIALQKGPDAINMWIGNSRSVTALHRDPMENIYVQISGRKHFVLLPPLCHACVNEKLLTPATYRRADNNDLTLCLDEGAEVVPLATWDPDEPLKNTNAFSHLARPIEAILEPGDMLYLPAMWYHKVKQSCEDDGEGFVVAVNYWYDMDFSGPFYPATTFVRTMGLDQSLS